jgi:hypothetical protein
MVSIEIEQAVLPREHAVASRTRFASDMPEKPGAGCGLEEQR